jgi:two-component system, OmpR family, response regulator
MSEVRSSHEGSAMTTLGTILIAEKDAAIADVLIELLTDEGYIVQRVARGSDALAALQAKPPDLALINLSLLDLGGWELLSAVRAQSIDVPIVVMTASTLVAEALTAAGACACLYKPFDLDELLACVREHIRQR